MLSTLARPYFIAAHTLCQWAITLRLAVTSQTAKNLYKTLWIVAQVAFWMTVLAALYTRQAGRWFRAYYQAEWADTVQSILTYPDRCIDASPALTSTADSSSEHPVKGDEALPENVDSILNSDRTSTAKLRALAQCSRSRQTHAQSRYQTGFDRLSQRLSSSQQSMTMGGDRAPVSGGDRGLDSEMSAPPGFDMPLSTTPLPEDYGDALRAANTGDEKAIAAIQAFKTWCYQQPHGAAPFNQVYWDAWRKQQRAQIDRLRPHFEIQYRVPAQNAMGGTASWTPLRLDNDRLSTLDATVAADAYQQAQQHFATGEVLLVKFTPEIISTP